jgi:hypothetical protein
MVVPSRDSIWPIQMMVNPNMPDWPPSAETSMRPSDPDSLSNRVVFNVILSQSEYVDRVTVVPLERLSYALRKEAQLRGWKTFLDLSEAFAALYGFALVG